MNFNSGSKINQLQVIGAGFGRTGTNSLKLALNELGFKCYHMHELFLYNDHLIWKEILKKPKNSRNWNESLFALRDYSATVDWPTTEYYLEIFAENPDARVILTVRDSADKWYVSTLNSIYKMAKAKNCWQFKLIKILRGETLFNAGADIVWDGIFHWNFEDEERSKNIYREHIKQVQRNIPSEQLLIFNVKEGWEPLCKFLNKEMPKVPFPRGNTTADKVQSYGPLMFKKNIITAVVAVSLCMVAVGIGKYCQHYWKTK